ncbi:polysaccharide biosynthesis protein [Aerococcaceae bacterium DSM 111176]|nr:polysaccharide biosynthesis protein [Aerococcaceae bacterium DSM 111176]
MANQSFLKNLVNFVTSWTNRQRIFAWRALDMLAIFVASFVSYIILYDIISVRPIQWAIFILLASTIYFVVLHLFKVDQRISRYSSLLDFINVFVSQFVSNITAGLALSLLMDSFSLRFVVITALFASVFSTFYRIIWRGVYTSQSLARFQIEIEDMATKNVLVIGAGDGGSLFVQSYKRHPEGLNVVGILDKDENKIGTNISGVPVLGSDEELVEIAQQHDVDEIIIAIPSLKPEAYERILTIANDIDVPVFKMPSVEKVLQGKHQQKDMKKVEITDLLGRQEIELDESQLRQEIEGKVILITGAGGSIGSEIARQVSKFNPLKLILLGHGENSIYLIYHELIKKPGMMTQYIPVIADVQHYDRLLEVFKEHKPDIVYHAAAHKHVPLMEVNPIEALKNNVYGSYRVAKAVDAAGVRKMVMISTDKAVNPPNVMGATKRIAELLVIGMNKKSDSIFCAVRFGNVLGSRGSVIPVFEKQIAAGGPVTVTDFRMTRYFMTIPEASRLVVFAGAFAEGSEVFVLNMGEPVKILDLAKKLILLSGFSEAEIPIVESGIRPGEKLYEELLTSSELVDKQLDENIFIGQVIDQPIEETLAFVESVKDEPSGELKKELVRYANESHIIEKDDEETIIIPDEAEIVDEAE